MSWQLRSAAATRVEFLGESKLIINWLRGLCKVQYAFYQKRVAWLLKQLERLCSKFFLAPCSDAADFHRHIFRELNGQADAKANLGRSGVRMSWHTSEAVHMKCIRICFDGSLKD